MYAIPLASVVCTLAACEGLESSGGGNGASTTPTPDCVAATGTLSGDAVIPGSAVGNAEDQPASSALITLTPSGGESIQAMADTSGHFEFDLEVGTWSVEAEHPDQCYTPEPQAVSITRCETTTLVLQLSDCFG